jgi:curved DNA-binding protein CbpA
LALTATTRDIKKAYRARALEVHPDKCIGCDDTKRARNQRAFVELAGAYETLSNDDTRGEYERGTGRWAPTHDGSNDDGDSGDGSGGGGAFRADAWARSQFDMARDPLLTVRGWVTLIAMTGAGLGVARGAKAAQRGAKRGARAIKATASARAGKERVAARGELSAARSRGAVSGAERQKREHFRRALAEAVRASWNVPREIARVLSDDNIHTGTETCGSGENSNISRRLPDRLTTLVADARRAAAGAEKLAAAAEKAALSAGARAGAREEGSHWAAGSGEVADWSAADSSAPHSQSGETRLRTARGIRIAGDGDNGVSHDGDGGSKVDDDVGNDGAEDNSGKP